MADLPSNSALKRQPSAKKVRQTRIVVAEANAELRAAIAWALRQDGYVVLELEDGAEATDYLVDMLIARDRHGADAFVVGVTLPVVNGTDVVDGLRSFDESTPCILIGRHATPRLYARADKLGALVLEWPF